MGTMTTMVATPMSIMVPEATMGAEGTITTVGTTTETATITTMIPTTIERRELVKSSDATFLIAVQEKNIETCKKSLKALATFVGTGKDFGREASNLK